MRTSEILKGAIRAIRLHGWGRGDEALCAVRAIGFATHPQYGLRGCYTSADSRAVRALQDVLGIDPAIYCRSAVVCWNDVEAKDAEEVIAALERAAVIEEAKESQATVTPALATVSS